MTKTEMTTTTKPKPEDGVVIVPQAKMDAFNRLDMTSREVNKQIHDAPSDIIRAAVMARGMKLMLEALTPEICTDLCALQGSKLGFRTDKDQAGGYNPAEVRDVLAEALMRGVQVTGNQINIIAGQLYITREGYEYMLANLDGMSNLRIDIGVPKNNGETGALVPCKAAWKMHGIDDSLECTETPEGDFRIPIRVNKAMGIDAIMGKARSKLLRRVYERATNSSLLAPATDADVETVEGAVVTQQFDERGLPANKTR